MAMEMEMGTEMATPLDKFDDTKDLYVDNVLRARLGGKTRQPFATILKWSAWNGLFRAARTGFELRAGTDMWTKPLGHRPRAHEGADHWRHFVLWVSTKNKPKIHELCVSIKMQIATEARGGVMHSGRGCQEGCSCLLPYFCLFAFLSVGLTVAILWVFNLHAPNVTRCLPSLATLTFLRHMRAWHALVRPDISSVRTSSPAQISADHWMLGGCVSSCHPCRWMDDADGTVTN